MNDDHRVGLPVRATTRGATNEPGKRTPAVQHVNDDHAEDLLAIARALGGHLDATAARAQDIRAVGIDLVIDTPGGQADARVAFSEPVATGGPDGLRAAFAELARRARAAIAAAENE